MKITIRGREFNVVRKPGKMVDGTLGFYFELTGKRGAAYFTMTNIHTDLHFVCNSRVGRSGLPFNGVWIKDDNGTPVVVAQ